MTATPEPDEVDSAYGSPGRDSDEDSTVTVTSDHLDYTEEYGRRYATHSGAECLFPTDNQEQERLVLFDHLVQKALGSRRHCAPVSLADGRVLDLGTGTGVWAVQMGDGHPACLFTGVDVSPIQPRWVPPNVSFELFDIESTWSWTFPQTFIFARQLAGSIVNWPRLVDQCHDNLEDGGWVEFQELDLDHYAEDNSVQEGNKVLELYDLQRTALSNLGRRLNVADHVEQLLREKGFQNIVHACVKIPLGTWPRDPKYKSVGLFRKHEFNTGLEALTLKSFCKGLGWTPAAVQTFLTDVRRDAERREVHLISNLHVIYGQKSPVPNSA